MQVVAQSSWCYMKIRISPHGLEKADVQENLQGFKVKMFFDCWWVVL